MGKILFLSLFFLVTQNSNLFGQQDIKSKVDSINSIGYQSIVSDIRTSIEYFSKNLKDAESINYKRGMAEANNKLGLAYYLNGQYEKSTNSFLRSIELFDELDDTEKLAYVYGEFGYQLKRRDLEKANFYMLRAIKIAKKNEHDSILIKLYDNYGVLKEMGSQLDSAEYYYEFALKRKRSQKDSIGIPYTLNKLAGIHELKGNRAEAFRYMKLSDKYRENERGMFGRAENYAMYGDLYKTFGNIDSAIINYKKCLDIAFEEGINFLVRYSYKQLTGLFQKKGMYKEAFNNLDKFVAYQDSVLNAEVQKKVAQLEIKYESEKKDRQLAESELELSQLNSRLYLLGGISLVLILLSFGIYNNQKKKRERIKKELIMQNKLSNAELLNRMNEEKLKISRELHDNIGSQLTFMVSSLDNLNITENDESKRRKIQNLSKFGKDTLHDLRNTVWAIKNHDADFDHLLLKINELVQNINNNIDKINVEVNSIADDSIKLTTTQRLNIYRIIQEAIQNSLKHSDADKIELNIEPANGKLVIDINDNGKGFNPAVEKSNNGNGLLNMESRCKECGGEFKVESSEKGTKIICEISLN